MLLQQFILLCYLSLFSGCGITQEHTNNKFSASHEALIPGVFPHCFSISSSLDYSALNPTFRFRVEFCVIYDQQIQFVIKGPFGVETTCGIVDENGITILDRLYRVAYRWNYEQIKQQYHFHYNYQLIQSLLLGTACTSILIKNEKETLNTPAELRKYLAYTYHNVTGKVMGVQLVDEKCGHGVRFSYQRKALPSKDYFTCLAGMKIHFSLTDKEKLYQGSIALRKLKFKQLKKPNMKFTVPIDYIRCF